MTAVCERQGSGMTPILMKAGAQVLVTNERSGSG